MFIEAEIYKYILSILMVFVLVNDLLKYTIPNWVSVVLLLLYGFYIVDSGDFSNLIPTLIFALAVFVVSFGLYCMDWIGGGDAKFFSALCLWVGWGDSSGEFLILTAVFGGALSLLLLFTRIVIKFYNFGKKKTLPVLLRSGAPVPYGIAIALGFLTVLWHNANLLQ